METATSMPIYPLSQNRKMKVLLVSHAYVAQPYLEKPRALAARSDVNLTLLVPKFWRHPLGKLFFSPTVEDRHYRQETMPVFFNGRNGKFMFSWVPLVRVLRQINPDILHIEEEPLSLSAFQLVLLSRLIPKARIVVFAWENLHFPQDPLRAYVENYTIRHLDHLIVGNREAKRIFIAKGTPEDRISICPQIGITLKSSSLKRPIEKTDAFTIGFAGRLVKEKGVFTLLKAFSRLPRCARLLIVGDGDARSDFCQRAETLCVQSRVHLVGKVPHQEVGKYIRAMDVLVLPSLTTKRWMEQFGHVIIEAMALGVPVVGSSSGAIPEVIGDAGLVFREDDDKALEDSLREIMGNEKLRLDLIDRGKSRCESNYTHERIADKTLEIYHSVLARNRR